MTTPEPAPDRPTRGRTRAGRLRALDAFLAREEAALLRRSDGAWAAAPVVDVGFGEQPWTTLELAAACAAVNPRLPVVGIEREPDRVDAARAQAEANAEGEQGPAWIHGGFEAVGALADRPRLVRAMNVLRTYPAAEVPAAHRLLSGPLLPGGLLVEGSADPEGSLITAHLIRRTVSGAVREGLWLFTDFSLGFAPIQFRDWLPRDLRRRVVDGEPIAQFLEAWTQAWGAVRREQATGAKTAAAVFEASARRLAEAVEGVTASVEPAGGTLVWRPAGGVPEPQVRA